MTETVERLNLPAAIALAIATIAFALRLAVTPAGFVATDAAPAAAEFAADQAAEQVVAPPQFEITSVQIGRRIEGNLVTDLVDDNTFEGTPSNVAIQWDYLNATIGGQFVCEFQRHGQAQTQTALVLIQHVSGWGWCQLELEEPGDYAVRIKLADSEIWSGRITLLPSGGQEETAAQQQTESAPRGGFRSSVRSPPAPDPTARQSSQDPFPDRGGQGSGEPEPTVTCVLPTGSEMRATLEECRRASGVVYR